MQLYLWIVLGSAIGGFGRYWCSTLLTRQFGSRLPWGTLGVNVLGSLAMGLLAGLLLAGATAPADPAMLVLMAGVCGSFTTVSSFGLETLGLLEAGEWGRAALNIALNLLLCLTALAAGAGLSLLANGL